jgi:glycosyltransferase involved in cell wall biosynthesis/aminoglycoside phosphotransferase (APT) family kinase protein
MTAASEATLEALEPKPGQPRAAPTPIPRVRGAVAVFVTRFPRIAETFILREINELERLGQPVVLVPLLRNHSLVVHEEAKPWMGRALFMPLLSLAIVKANAVRLVREPRRYLGLLLSLIGRTALRPSVLLRTLALFPKSVYLASYLPRLGIKHVHAHFAVHPTTMAYIVSSLSNMTYSFTIHGPDVFVHRLLLREKIAGAKFVRAVSTFIKAFVSGLYPDESEGKIEVVHVGVNPSVYEDAAEHAEGRSARIQILSVAALTSAKGYHFLVDACAMLAREGLDFECKIVGEGTQRGAIADRIQQHELGDRIRMLGALPQHEVARLMGDADIFVLPSVIAWNGQMDGIPISLMEAMAAGKPVIGSAISGIPELVQHETNGVLVDSTHPERIAGAIRRLVEDPGLRFFLGRAGQERVRSEFDVRRTSDKLIDLFARHDRPERTAQQEIATLNWGRLNTCALGVRRLRERRDSFVAELTITDGISWRDVVVKRQRGRSGESRSAFDRARDEYRVLKDLRARMPGPSGEMTNGISYTVPRALVLDDQHAALIMERARGKPLESLIRNSRNRTLGRGLLTPVRRAGRWLNVMQQATHVDDDGRHLLTAIVVVAARDLELAAAVDRSLRRERARIIDTLRALETRVAARPVPTVGHHGDYWPGNIFVGERRVEVIDFEGFREGLPLEDVAYFLVHFRMYFDYPIFRRYLPRLQQSFLDGYGEGPFKVDQDEMRLLTIAKSLQVLARGGIASARGLRASWHRKRLRGLILENLT